MLFHVRYEHSHADLNSSISLFLWKGLWVFPKDSLWFLVWFCLLLEMDFLLCMCQPEQSHGEAVRCGVQSLRAQFPLLS